MLGRDRLQDSVHRRKLDLPSSTQWCDATHYAASLTEFRQLNPAKGRTWGAGAPLATAPLVGAPATGEVYFDLGLANSQLHWRCMQHT